MFDPSDFNLPSLVTQAWTEKTVLEYMKEHGEKFDSKLVQFTPLCRFDRENGGNVSIPIKIELKWDPDAQNDLPNSLVVKQFTVEKVVDLLKTDGEEEKIKFLIGVHNNECYFYQSIFLAYRQNNLVLLLLQGFFRGLRVPKCYHAEGCKAADKSGFLLFEDLYAGMSVDYYQGFTLQQVYAIADSIASLQAFGLKRDLANCHENVDVKHWTLTAASRIYFFNAIKERYPEEFSDISLDDANKLDNGENFHRICFGETPFPVLVHGDLWTNNIMWNVENGAATDKLLAIIDWQVGHMGNPGEDFGRLLVLHLSPEARREHELGILHRYYDRLSLLLDHKVPFDFDYVLTWYRKSLASQSMIACMNHMLKPWIKTKEPAETLHVAKRVSDAIRDALKYVD